MLQKTKWSRGERLLCCGSLSTKEHRRLVDDRRWLFRTPRFTIIEDEIVKSETWRGKKSGLSLKQGQYIVRNVYYRHKKYPDFMRTAMTISDSTRGLGLLEYCFTGSEHHVSPHNPRSSSSYIPTTLPTRDASKEKVTPHKGPLSIFDESFEEAGRIVHCEIGADMPRNVKQISNA